MSDFLDRAIESVIKREGDYSDDPRDTGGKTRYGITERVARAHGYQGDMRQLPRDLAVKIYTIDYWTKPGFARVAQHSPKLAERMLDCGINMGPGKAGAFLQRALNVLTEAALKVDGECGPATIGALGAFFRQRPGKVGETILVNAFNGLQATRYIELAEQRPQNRAFIAGWLSHRIW